MARPKKAVDVAEVLRLRQEGLSWPVIARFMRLGLGTVYRACQTAKTCPEPFQNPKRAIYATDCECAREALRTLGVFADLAAKTHTRGKLSTPWRRRPHARWAPERDL